MKVMIAGLGLIGGSMAKSLVRSSIKVDGFDRDNVIDYALKNNIIENKANDFSKYDLVFIALPPDATMNFIENNTFKDNAIVSDICGVKGVVEKLVYSKPRNFKYVGCHPMAGKEVSGIENSTEKLFDNANMIIIENENTNAEAVQTLTELFTKMGFKLIKHCSADHHDRKIAYTSQLAHIVSNAYVKSPAGKNYVGFTGGSFQDMTRIAGVDEEVWTRLYMLNREKIEKELSTLISNLQKYLEAFKNNDEPTLKQLLKEGRNEKARLDAEKPII